MTERKRTQKLDRAVPTLTAEEESFLSAISAPENAHLFSLEAVSNAFAHTKKLRPVMTLPHQRTRALLKTRRFLETLTLPGDTPGLPDDMRKTAKRLLQHYPTDTDLEETHEGAPDTLGPVEQRQPLGEPAPGRKTGASPLHPLKPGFGARELTPEEQAKYDKEVAAWRKRTPYG